MVVIIVRTPATLNSWKTNLSSVCKKINDENENRKIKKQLPHFSIPILKVPDPFNAL